MLRAAGWWALTIAMLVVIDDLTYGPFFWVFSRFAPVGAIALAFTIYWIVQVYLVWAATGDNPGRVASFFLKRLELDRRNEEIAKREASLLKRIGGPLVAIPMALVVGGVVPCLALWRLGFDVWTVRKLAVLTSAIYAAEFAYLHAYLPNVIV